VFYFILLTFIRTYLLYPHFPNLTLLLIIVISKQICSLFAVDIYITISYVRTLSIFTRTHTFNIYTYAHFQYLHRLQQYMKPESIHTYIHIGNKHVMYH